MNEKIIKFKAHKFIISDKTICPEPAKLHIPDWYKKVPNKNDPLLRTIKACKPFLDSLLAGYILKNPVDQQINFNIENPEHKKVGSWVQVNQIIRDGDLPNKLNFNKGNEIHSPNQLGGKTCPFVQKNRGYPIYKISNPWTITLPKGYSAIYMPPINRPDDRFEILTGIVDYGHTVPTNFPTIFKKEGTWVLEKGTPIACVFPFKIEKWKMVIEEMTEEEYTKNNFSLGQTLTKFYERFKWTKKSWS